MRMKKIATADQCAAAPRGNQRADTRIQAEVDQILNEIQRRDDEAMAPFFELMERENEPVDRMLEELSQQDITTFNSLINGEGAE